MSFEEIIKSLRDKEEAVTRCFFFWDGPSLEKINEVRRTNPSAALKMPRPVCATARPVLIKTLCRIYGPGNFNYEEKVSGLYEHIMSTDALAKISDTGRIMGFLATVAFNFWLGEKKKESMLLDNMPSDYLIVEKHDTMDDTEKLDVKRFVSEVLAAMPNRSYAKLLDDEVLEIMGLSGARKAERTRIAAEKLGISVDHLYVRISSAKKQFKLTAQKIMQGRI